MNRYSLSKTLAIISLLFQRTHRPPTVIYRINKIIVIKPERRNKSSSRALSHHGFSEKQDVKSVRTNNITNFFLNLHFFNTLNIPRDDFHKKLYVGTVHDQRTSLKSSRTKRPGGRINRGTYENLSLIQQIEKPVLQPNHQYRKSPI